MITRLFFYILTGILGLFLAARFVPNVEFFGTVQMLLIIGSTLGLINFFIKPILNAITLPLKFLTFGLFSLVINMGLVWAVEIFFPKDLEITGLIPLFWTTIIIWGLSLVFGLYDNRKNNL